MIFRLPVACVALTASLCLAAAPAQAQSSDTGASSRNDALYRQLGGQAGLAKLMDDFMPRLLADRRLQPFFKDVNQEHLKEELATQFCEVSGGPCRRRGPDMKRVHEGFDIDRA